MKAGRGASRGPGGPPSKGWLSHKEEGCGRGVGFDQGVAVFGDAADFIAVAQASVAVEGDAGDLFGIETGAEKEAHRLVTRARPEVDAKAEGRAGISDPDDTHVGSGLLFGADHQQRLIGVGPWRFRCGPVGPERYL